MPMMERLDGSDWLTLAESIGSLDLVPGTSVGTVLHLPQFILDLL